MKTAVILVTLCFATASLAATEPEILARLVAEWERIDAGMVEPLF